MPSKTKVVAFLTLATATGILYVISLTDYKAFPSYLMSMATPTVERDSKHYLSTTTPVNDNQTSMVTTTTKTASTTVLRPNLKETDISSPKPTSKPTIMESIQDTKINWQEINSNFVRCQMKAVVENDECRIVHRNSKAYWRSSQSTKGYQIDFQRIELASSCCAFNHSELMAPSPSSSMYPWEKDYLSQGPMQNIKDTAWANHSNVTLLTKGPFHVGQNVQFLVKVRTGWGKPRGVGGDIVYFLLANDKLKASVAAKVKDNKNGTYLATVVLPWVGKAFAKAIIVHTREVFRSLLYVQRLFNTFRWFTGIFIKGSLSEATPCSSLPHIPAFPPTDICNLTEANGGILWFCGKPVKRNLTCNDWFGTRKTSSDGLMPLGEEEDKWEMFNKTKRQIFIATSLVLDVEGKDNKSQVIDSPKIWCGERDLKTTFDDVTSTGYFYNKEWFPFACRLPKVDNAFILKCLTNTTVVWHAPLRCDIESINNSIQYFPPKNPFYGSVGEIITNDQLTSFVSKLDSIPAHGRYIVHVHQFLHLIQVHPVVADRRARHLRTVLARLLDRNPQVYVIVQSPHTAYDAMTGNKLKMSFFLFELQRNILRGLGDRVMFANTFDLTIAAENDNGHPDISLDFTTLYLGHVCGRQ